MISQRAKYAFKALFSLADLKPGETASIEAIAEDAGVPRKFLEHILLDLKKKGIVASRRGRAGGYVMLRPAAALTIGAILRAVDGPMAPLPCLSRTAYSRCTDCRDEKACDVRRLFAETYAGMLALMETETLAAAMKGRGARRRPAARRPSGR